MARVQNCCCFSLKTGTLIIATLGWIFTIVKIFGLVGAAGSAQNKQESQYGSMYEPEEQQAMGASSLGYRIGYAVVSLITCVLLVVGIYKKSSNYFIPWLIVDCIECVAISIITVICFVFIFIVGHPGSIVLGIMFVVLVGVSALCWYFWIVVYSHYQEVKSEVVNVPTGGNVYYSPTSTNPPPYEKDRTQMA